MKLPVPKSGDLCQQCVGLCCRYYAFEIDKPRTRGDFEDIRWYLLHEDSSVFVEDGEWYIQVNRKCKQLLPDNRCGIYENRPPICRKYKTDGCDWHADAYDYELLFTEPEQIAAYAKDYLAKQRKRRAAAARRKAGAKPAAAARRTQTARRSAARRPIPLPVLKSA